MDDRAIAAAAFLTGTFAHILAPDVTVTSDAAVVAGRDECALFIGAVLAGLAPDSIDREEINGEPGLALRRQGRVVGVVVLRTSRSLIEQLWLVTDTKKLRAWN